MREQNIITILLLFFLSSCGGDKCKNKLTVDGKYVNSSNKDDINYIVLNKNGTYFSYYKAKRTPSKSHSGKWTFTSDDCQVNFDKWKDIVGYIKLDQLSYGFAYHRNDKLIFFDDLDNPEYIKEE